ncbi:MAG: LamG-like jellyroll fold domain-containing protein, partial [Mycoplasma sp.]
GTTTINTKNEIWKNDVWYHIAITCANGKTTLFLNGIEESVFEKVVKTKNVSSIKIGTKSFNAKLNDIIIYRRALSSVEINNLSKAKILHYTFNDDVGVCGIENLSMMADFDDDREGLITWSTKGGGKYEVINDPVVVGKKCWKITNQAKTAFSGIIPSNAKLCSKPLEIGKTYTLSAQIYIPGKLSGTWEFHRHVRHDGACASSCHPYTTIGGRSSFNDSTEKGVWFDFYHVLTITSGILDPSKYISCMPFITTSGSDICPTESESIYMKNYRLYEGNYNPSFKYNNKQDYIFDMSDYENNSEANLPFPIWTTDSKIGSGSYDFTNKGLIKTTGKTFNTVDALTISAIVKQTSQGASTILLKENTYRLSITDLGKICINFADATMYESATSIVINEWTFIS